VIEKAVASRPEEGPLYLALAQYYREIGSREKAAELTQKAKSLAAPARD
jgi:Tfp pilus assembly protein PilF